jgi:hypothetical protein
MQAESEQTNMRFQDLAGSEDIQNEVDELLREIEQDSKQKIMEEKRVQVNLPQSKDV